MIENIAGVKWALDALRHNAAKYLHYAKYYDGEHRLTFATEKFRNTFGQLFSELSVNYCPICVDVPADRLQLTGFSVVAEGEGEVAKTTIADAKITEILRRNRMNKRNGEVHQEALKTGDCYVVVDWENPDDPSEPRATIHPNVAGRCAVKYDEQNPGYVTQACRWWSEDVDVNGKTRYRIRLNLFYRDRIEKYCTDPQASYDLPDNANKFSQLPSGLGEWKITNIYNKVPVFHFANDAPIGSTGRSELRDITPVQDSLNKTVCDKLVAMEFQAFRQRYVAGLEIQLDDNGNPIAPFHGGIDRMWIIPPQKDENGKPLPASDAQPINIGDLDATDITQFIAVKDSFRKDISAISGIPMHYFMDAGGGWPSGEALKTAEQRLTSKVDDRKVGFGNVWEDVIRLCLEIEGAEDVQVEASWKDTGPRSVTDDLNNAKTKMQDLKIPAKQVYSELGYKPSQIEKFEEDLNEQQVLQTRREQAVVVPTVARNRG